MRRRAPSEPATGDGPDHRRQADPAVRAPVVDPGPVKSGVRPPQQARSRAALQRLVASAEHVLVNEGLDEFTIARVAEHAGVSVGGVYRRFASKEQLIEAVKHELLARLENAVAKALRTAQPSLAGVIHAFTAALSQTFAESGRVIPVILAGGRAADPPEQGLRIATGLQQRFFDAAAPYREQIRHERPASALTVVFRSVIAAGAHRAALAPWWPDGLTWQQWAHEIADMTTAYLTAEHKNTPGAT
ncbi:TetR/AcrR family transcriptional regulator [Mycobacterium sp. SM1]|uniref:TetR/AcrR family transcriptional regulator n=1 Tax=Mycobacterium sp. SM1 TaxID=2816243 RepID=UPI001BCEDB39|nr:TetR/AcrR family transcriptional regulator [Mycobacterium sp. SM1]MBS4729444.1 TetR/AcrR family transcriptional regulator [Mycobacterium sp. SM1]